MYGDVARAISTLKTRRHELYVVAQNLIEFWAVATRQLINNGLGLTVAQAEDELTKLKTIFTILPDTADILPKWEQLIVKYQVLGKQAHDARLVAAMIVGVGHGLTEVCGDGLEVFRERLHARARGIGGVGRSGEKQQKEQGFVHAESL